MFGVNLFTISHRYRKMKIIIFNIGLTKFSDLLPTFKFFISLSTASFSLTDNFVILRKSVCVSVWYFKVKKPHTGIVPKLRMVGETYTGCNAQ